MDSGETNGGGPATPLQVVAGVALRDRRYLICQRPAHKRHGGLWEFPGGKLEPGEDLAAALVRELMEELDLHDVTAGRLLHVEHPPSGKLVLHFMEAHFVSQPKCLEHQAMRWASLAELLILPLAPADRTFVRAVRAGTVKPS